jgi:hypothetical protein
MPGAAKDLDRISSLYTRLAYADDTLSVESRSHLLQQFKRAVRQFRPVQK